jgi:hypothetical protein
LQAPPGRFQKSTTHLRELPGKRDFRLAKSRESGHQACSPASVPGRHASGNMDRNRRMRIALLEIQDHGGLFCVEGQRKTRLACR